MEPKDISSYDTLNNAPTEPEPFQQPTRRSSLPMIGGILLILVGVLGLFTWTAVFAVDASMISSMIPEGTPLTAEQLQTILTTCAVIGCILSVFALLAGFLALQRKVWALTILGSFLGLLTVGPMFLGSGLSLIALILLALSRKDFKTTGENKS